MQNFRYFNPKSLFWSLPQIPDPKPAATPVMGKKIPFIIFSCSRPCGSDQAWRGGEKQEQGWVRGCAGPKKSALHPKTEELPAEALHKCFIGRREMDTKQDSDREATDRDTFSFRGGQTAMTRGHRGATPGWKSSHGASIPPAELGAKSQRVIPRIWAVLGMLEASTPQLKGSSEGEKGQSSSLGAVLAPAHPKGSRICRI